MEAQQSFQLEHIADPRLKHLAALELEVLAAVRGRLTRLLDDRSFKLILFGSKARGDFDDNSDLDLAIIVNGLDHPLKLAIFDVIADAELEHLKTLSALVLSSEDFQRLKSRERRIALDIEREGIEL